MDARPGCGGWRAKGIPLFGLAIALLAGLPLLGQTSLLLSLNPAADTLVEADLTAGTYLLLVPTVWVEVTVQTPPWSLTSAVTVLSQPGGADTPGAEALEVENEAGGWEAGGGAVKLDQATPSDAFSNSLRLHLPSLKDGGVGTYQFRITYTLTSVGGGDAQSVSLGVDASEVVTVSVTASPEDESVPEGALAGRYVVLALEATVEAAAVTSYRLEATASLSVLHGPIPSAGVGILEVRAVTVSHSTGTIVPNPALPKPLHALTPLLLLTEDFLAENSAGDPTQARVSFRIDQDKLENTESGAAYQFRVTFTVTEE